MRAVKLLLVGIALVSLSACTAFYPNWGAETPQDAFSNETQIGDVIEESTESELETETDSTSEVVAEVPEEVAVEVAPEVVQTKVRVEIYSATVYQDEGLLEVIAQGLGFVEDGGSCTLRFISGDQEKSKTVQSGSSSDYTQCSPIDLPLSGLPSGTGVVTVSYESANHTGISEPVSVVIP